MDRLRLRDGQHQVRGEAGGAAPAGRRALCPDPPRPPAPAPREGEGGATGSEGAASLVPGPSLRPWPGALEDPAPEGEGSRAGWGSGARRRPDHLPPGAGNLGDGQVEELGALCWIKSALPTPFSFSAAS